MFRAWPLLTERTPRSGDSSVPLFWLYDELHENEGCSHFPRETL